MNPTVAGMIVFACTLGGALGGRELRAVLREHNFDAESKETVRLGLGLIATMTALVLGLVTASAKTSFDAMDEAVEHTAIDVLTLDRLLARYGPEAREIRTALQHSIAGRIDMTWPQDSSRPPQLDPSEAATGAEGVADAIRGLTPQGDAQRSLQSRCLDLSEALLQARWVASAGGGPSVARPFLVVLVFWLTITFASFGLFAPRNALVFAVFFVCAASVGSAVFLILEMDGPFDGVLRVSADPLHYAHEHLNK